MYANYLTQKKFIQVIDIKINSCNTISLDNLIDLYSFLGCTHLLVSKQNQIKSSIYLSESCKASIIEAQKQLVNYISTNDGLKSRDWSKLNIEYDQTNNGRSSLYGFIYPVRMSIWDISDQYIKLPKGKPLRLAIAYGSSIEATIWQRVQAVMSSTQYKNSISSKIIENCTLFSQVEFSVSRTPGSERVFGIKLGSNQVVPFQGVTPSCGSNEGLRLLNWETYYTDC